MCIPRTLWVGKVGLRDGLEWPSSATGPSLLGSMGPRAGQVKTRTNYQVSLFVLHCSAKSTPTICPPNKTPTTHNNSQVKPVEADNKAVSSAASSSAAAPPFCTSAVPVSSYIVSPKGAKGGPSGTGSIIGPHIISSPTSYIWMSLGGTPNSRASLDARSCPRQKHFSSSTIIHRGIGIYHSLGSLKT